HTPTTEISTPSLHDALPIYHKNRPRDLLRNLLISRRHVIERAMWFDVIRPYAEVGSDCLKNAELIAHPFKNFIRRNWEFFSAERSEEHTSELQSRRDLVCRL